MKRRWPTDPEREAGRTIAGLKEGKKRVVFTYSVNSGYSCLDPCVPDLKRLWRDTVLAP